MANWNNETMDLFPASHDGGSSQNPNQIPLYPPSTNPMSTYPPSTNPMFQSYPPSTNPMFQSYPPSTNPMFQSYPPSTNPMFQPYGYGPYSQIAGSSGSTNAAECSDYSRLQTGDDASPDMFTQQTPRITPQQTPGNTPPMTPSEATPTTTEDERTETDSRGKKPKRHRVPEYKAPWWRYYQIIKNKEQVCIRAICLVKDCGSILSHNTLNGSSHIKRHAEKHIAEGKEPERVPTSTQTQLNPDGSGFFSYNPNKGLQSMARYIAHAEKPLNFGECRKLEDMIKHALQPYFKKISYKRVRREVQKQYKERLAQLHDFFKKSKSKMAVTSDVWTAGEHGLSYSCLTAHWIDENWVIQKRVLSVRILPFPHTAEAIYDHLIDLFKEFHIKDRVISISFDNASNNNASIPFFKTALSPIMDGELFHQRCACHILNLVVISGTSVPQVKEIITKYKNGLNHIDSHGKKKQEFRERCTQMGFRKIKIPWDTETRWNSTYRLLKTTMGHRRPIESILNATTDGQRYLLSDYEWDILTRLLPFLSNFFEATVRLSCTYTPTSSSLLVQLVMISDWYFRNLTDFENHPVLIEVMNQMRGKFLKYWKEIPTLAIVGSVLDPRYKVTMTADMIATFNANMGLPSFDEERHVRNKIERLFAIYAEQQGSSSASTSRGPAPQPERQGAMSSLLRAIHRRRPNEGGSSSSERANDEFKKYEGYPFSSDEIADPNFDILAYWEAHEKVWPVISCIARDILAIPVSTVPSESCFSACNRVLTDKRNKLGNKMFEALVCLKDWFDADYRQQDRSKMYNTSEEEPATSGFDTEYNTSEQDDGSDFEPPEPQNWWNYPQYYM